MSALLLTVLLVTLVHDYPNVDAIKCYVCQSNVDPKCADPFDNLTLPITDCDAYPRVDLAIKTEYDLVEEKTTSFFGIISGQGSPTIEPMMATFCRKIRQKVNGEWRTIRGCGYLDKPHDAFDGQMNTCRMRYGNHDVFMESCICNLKDGCNSAPGTANICQSMYFILPIMTMLTYRLSGLLSVSKS